MIGGGGCLNTLDDSKYVGLYIKSTSVPGCVSFGFVKVEKSSFLLQIDVTRQTGLIGGFFFLQ